MRETYYIYTIRLPDGVNELILPDANGDYTIYLADRLDGEHRLKAFWHAVDHVRRGDFDTDKRDSDADNIERDAHGETA